MTDREALCEAVASEIDDAPMYQMRRNKALPGNQYEVFLADESETTIRVVETFAAPWEAKNYAEAMTRLARADAALSVIGKACAEVAEQAEHYRESAAVAILTLTGAASDG